MHKDESLPPSRSLIRSWLLLICNIRKQAKRDGKLEDFESYWLSTEKRKGTWNQIESDLRTLDGNYLIDD